jgi:hypothetical protein
LKFVRLTTGPLSSCNEIDAQQGGTPGGEKLN